ncbi:MAG: hypothetical protein JWO19_1145 [Bryobacterales bacterium]|nr:hypothetical protein [Bryobacterales bacterium]
MTACLLLGLASLTAAQTAQTRVEYVGGTAQLAGGTQGSIVLADDRYLAFYAGKTQTRVAYDRVNLVEYGQQVDRRLALALVISPVFLLSKSRKHFLTIGYSGEDGKQQAMVFRVDKNSIRSTLAGLEARTGLKIQYQDEQARKARNQ